MTDDLVGRLRAWSPLIASGYECPAAAQPMDEAAARIEALEAALKVIARKTSPTFGRGVMSGEEAASIARAALTPEAPHAD